jgi:hypothetical protein
MKQRKATFGTLSLFAFFVGILVGVSSAAEMVSGSEEMASLGAALAGIGFLLLACVPSLVFAVIGLLRKEKPLWPSVTGFVLSIFPGGLGLRMLAEILLGCFKHLLKI